MVDYPVTGSVCVIAPKGCLWWQLLRNVSAHAFFRFWICRRIAIGSRTLQFGLPVGGIASNHNKIHTVCAVHFMKARGISLAMPFWISQLWLLKVILKQHLTFVQNFSKEIKEPPWTISNIKTREKVKIKTSPQYRYITKQRGWQCFYARHKFMKCTVFFPVEKKKQYIG